MWRFLRKRRALRAYRTRLFHQLRDTFGRKLYYTSEEVVQAVRDIRASDEFVCYALGMFCDQAAFDAYHATTGEACDYGSMRHEVFAHVADVSPSDISFDTHDTGCGAHDTHHDSHQHDADHGHHDPGHDWSGGGDFGGGHHH